MNFRQKSIFLKTKKIQKNKNPHQNNLFCFRFFFKNHFNAGFYFFDFFLSSKKYFFDGN